MLKYLSFVGDRRSTMIKVIEIRICMLEMPPSSVFRGKNVVAASAHTKSDESVLFKVESRIREASFTMTSFSKPESSFEIHSAFLISAHERVFTCTLLFHTFFLVSLSLHIFLPHHSSLFW